jgi:hypothetical protein
MTDHPPFFNYNNDYAVMFAVLQRQELPPIPDSIMISPPLMALWRSCWSFQHSGRPSARFVVETMRRICTGDLQNPTNHQPDVSRPLMLLPMENPPDARDIRAVSNDIAGSAPAVEPRGKAR